MTPITYGGKARAWLEVVEPPEDHGATTEAPASDDIFIYPKERPERRQQARDKYEFTGGRE